MCGCLAREAHSGSRNARQTRGDEEHAVRDGVGGDQRSDLTLKRIGMAASATSRRSRPWAHRQRTYVESVGGAVGSPLEGRVAQAVGAHGGARVGHVLDAQRVNRLELDCPATPRASRQSALQRTLTRCSSTGPAERAQLPRPHPRVQGRSRVRANGSGRSSAAPMPHAHAIVILHADVRGCQD